MASSQRESINTGGRLAAYEPDGGFKSVGVAASAKYEIFTDYFVNADAKYDRLVGDAEKSPIVQSGRQEPILFRPRHFAPLLTQPVLTG